MSLCSPAYQDAGAGVVSRASQDFSCCMPAPVLRAKAQMLMLSRVSMSSPIPEPGDTGDRPSPICHLAESPPRRPAQLTAGWVRWLCRFLHICECLKRTSLASSQTELSASLYQSVFQWAEAAALMQEGNTFSVWSPPVPMC